jgi:hypothetical protein
MGADIGAEDVVLHHPGEEGEGCVLAAADRAQNCQEGIDDPEGNAGHPGRLAEDIESQRTDLGIGEDDGAANLDDGCCCADWAACRQARPSLPIRATPGPGFAFLFEDCPATRVRIPGSP